MTEPKLTDYTRFVSDGEDIDVEGDDGAVVDPPDDEDDDDDDNE